MDAGDSGGRAAERFAACHRLHPMAELAIRETARKHDLIILAEYLHLPRSGPGKLNAPQDVCNRIFDSDKRKPSAPGIEPTCPNLSLNARTAP